MVELRTGSWTRKKARTKPSKARQDGRRRTEMAWR
jgi:hypothetical protein